MKVLFIVLHYNRDMGNYTCYASHSNSHEGQRIKALDQQIFQIQALNGNQQLI